MRTILNASMLAFAVGVLCPGIFPLALAEAPQVGSQPGSGFTTVLSSAMRYTMNYEQRFALLAAEEHYEQQILRPPNPGSNLSRSNPGGGGHARNQISNMRARSALACVMVTPGLSRAKPW